MNVGVLFSGGKDSTFSLHWAFLHGFNVRCLISFKPEREDSYMFHYPCVDITRLQAEAVGLPLEMFYTSGLRDLELKDLERGLEEVAMKYELDGIVTGALLSDYQRMNIALICEKVGLRVFNPLWRKNQESYMRELVDYGFKILITSINVYGIPIDLVGKILTRQDVELIIERARIYGFNPAFEGGEAETLVVDAPLFRKRLVIDKFRVVRTSEYTARLEIESVYLQDK